MSCRHAILILSLGVVSCSQVDDAPVDAGVSIDLIGIIQSLVIVFIAAPLLVKAIFPWGFRRSERQ